MLVRVMEKNLKLSWRGGERLRALYRDRCAVDVDDLTMIARVNGEEISRGSTRQMDHKVEDVVSYISRDETIYPGEIFGSGTVPLGSLVEHKRFLEDGDLIELEIERIGVLRDRHFEHRQINPSWESFRRALHGFMETAPVKSVAPNRRGRAVPVEEMHAYRAEYVRGQSTAIGVRCCLPDSWRGARLPRALGLPGFNGARFRVIEVSQALAEAPPRGPRRIYFGHFGAPGRKQKIAAADP